VSNKYKKMWIRIAFSAIILGIAVLLQIRGIFALPVFLVAYAVIGWDVLWRAVRNIAHGQMFDENFLMALATVGAFLTGKYPEAVAVMLFYQVGELFQSYAVGRSRKSIAALMDINPEWANLEADGQIVQVSPDEVEVGSVIVIRAGEKIPLDGIVLEGVSMIDTAALTGESLPRSVAPGDAVVSGCINKSGLLRVKTEKCYEDSTVARILELVENSAEKKAKAERFITRFARWYTPAVVGAAILLAVIPPLFMGGVWNEWIHRALIFLVVSCPCALVISVPLSFFGGIGAASKKGILIKGGNYLEALAKADTVVFDKTGTLTTGSFIVSEIWPCGGFTEEKLLEAAALAESISTHPISAALRNVYKMPIDPGRIGSASEIAGYGVRAVVDGAEILAGNARLMAENGLKIPDTDDEGTCVHVAVAGKYAGCIILADEEKANAQKAITMLREQGTRKIVMLTGDSQAAAEVLSRHLGVYEIYSKLLPADKVAHVERLMAEPGKDGNLVFVGDGINDAPVLARCDVGIAMGAMGSDAAIEAADIVLMDDDPAKVAHAIDISRRTMRIVHQNIVFAIAIKVLVMVLGALGISGMWEAVFADVGVSVIAILNAMRALNMGIRRKE